MLKEATRRDSTFMPAVAMMGGRVLAFAAAFLVPVVLVRVFDQTQFGTYKQVLLIFSTLYLLMPLGMAESLFYFLPRASSERGKYVANAFLFLAAAGLLGLAVLVAAGPRLAGWLGNPDLAGHMRLAGVFFALMMASAALEIVMVARGRYLWAAGSYAVSDLLRAALLVGAALLIGTLRGVLMGAVAFAAVRLGATLAYFSREFAGAFRPDGRLLGRQLAYAAPFGLSIVGDLVQLNFHQYAVSWYFDAATFAVYAVGCLSIPLVDFVAGPAGNVMMVRMGQVRVDGDGTTTLRIWHDTTRRLALLFLPLAALLMVVARELIVLLFTASYLASVPVFIIWSSSIIWSALVTDGVLRVHADTRFLLIQSILRVAVNVGLMYWALRAFGLTGAVMVAVFSTAASKALALGRVKQLLGVRLAQVLPWGTLARIAAAAAVAALAAAGMKYWLMLSPLPALATAGLAYAVTYAGLVWRLRLLSPEERVALAEWIGTRLAFRSPRDPEELAGT